VNRPQLREVGFMILAPPHPEEGRGYRTYGTQLPYPGRQGLSRRR
jgi:hypothetical protein